MEGCIIEIWREVTAYEDLYEVSDIGNVRNVRTGHILSPGVSQGYHYVALYKDGIRRNKQVHRLVAEAFIPNPMDYPLINHKDEIKTNNSVDNLEWCDYSYNVTYNGNASRISESLKGRTPWNKGKTMPDSFKKTVSIGMKNYYRNRKTG